MRINLKNNNHQQLLLRGLFLVSFVLDTAAWLSKAFVMPFLCRYCCVDTRTVIASDCKERGNLENNNFYRIFCYFFLRLPDLFFEYPCNDGANAHVTTPCRNVIGHASTYPRNNGSSYRYLFTATPLNSEARTAS
jgi:hypothetical protein